MIVCTICIAIAQLFFKFAISNRQISTLLIGSIFYGIGGVIFLSALRVEQVSNIYPMLAMVFVWVLIVSTIYLNESITASKLIGISSIVAGTILVGKGKND